MADIYYYGIRPLGPPRREGASASRLGLLRMVFDAEAESRYRAGEGAVILERIADWLTYGAPDATPAAAPVLSAYLDEDTPDLKWRKDDWGDEDETEPNMLLHSPPGKGVSPLRCYLTLEGGRRYETYVGAQHEFRRFRVTTAANNEETFAIARKWSEGIYAALMDAIGVTMPEPRPYRED